MTREAPVIRPYVVDDRDAVIAMLSGRDPWQRLGYTVEHWQRLLAPPLSGREGWVIADGAPAAGIALVRPSFLLGDYLELFAIASGAQHRGLGRALLAAVERAAFARARNLFVCVSDFNHSARRFYARNGYQQVGTLSDLLVAGSAELLLRKTTGPARAT